MLRKRALYVLVLLLAAGMFAGSIGAAGLPRVTGSGHGIVVGGVLRTATVSARVMPDGRVTGQGVGILHTDPVTVGHFEINCMRFFEIEGMAGKGAVLSGALTHVVNPFPGFPPEVDAVWAVFDAGEGREAEDIFTRAVLVPAGLLDCSYSHELLLDGTLVERGNVQVSD